MALFNNAAGDSNVFAVVPVIVGKPCATTTCGSNAETLQLSDTVCQCQCLTGYEGNADTGCTDIDECQSSPAPCDANADCANTVGSYQCACRSGFTGDGITCEDIIDCLPSNPCVKGVCTDVPGSYNCTCNPGTQPTSNPDVCEDICTADYCLHGGVCSVNAVSGDRVCSCPNEYTGDRCQNPATYRTLAIVFGVLGGVILVLLVVLLFVIWRRRKARKLSIA